MTSKLREKNTKMNDFLKLTFSMGSVDVGT